MNRKQGGYLVAFIFTVIIAVFFQDVLKKTNSVYYGGSGDGLKGYYGAIYHAKYDSSYMHLEGMNYPFGEHVYFTGNQTPLTNTVKFLKPVIDLSDDMVGIMNVGMLASIILSCILIYLILVRLKIPVLIAIISAIGITLMSPQWARLEGHYNLAYQFVIPFIIYQLLRFHQTKNYNHSLYIFIGVFLMMNMHPYFFPLASIFTGSYFLFYSIKNKFRLNTILEFIPHFFIQVILPFALFTSVLKLTSSVVDRTNMPWGFWEFNSNTTGILYPFGKPYQWIFDLFVERLEVSWEGVAYVGLFALIMLILSLLYRMVRIIKKGEFKAKENQEQEFVFFLLLAGIFGMAISFAFPFNLGAKEKLWLDSLGVIKQIRGIGRMNWTLFYAVNIFGVYWFVKIFEKRKYVFIIASVLMATMLFIDGYYQFKDLPNKINNSAENFEDTTHQKAQNKWISEVDLSKYQAIIPFPYFHIGSENLSANSTEEFKNYVLAVSVTTGIPTTGIALSRTSLSQTLKSLALHSEPYKALEILKDLKSTKPFLILADTSEIKTKEKFWIEHAKFLLSNGKVNVYELAFETIKQGYLIKREEALASLPPTQSVSNRWYSNDSTHFIIEDYNNFKNSKLEAFINQPVEIAKEQVLRVDKETKIEVLFWMNGMTKDLFPRSRVEIWHHKPDGEVYWIDYYGISDKFQTFDNDKGLLQLESYQKPNEKLSIYLINNDIKEEQVIEIDNLLIKYKNATIYKDSKTDLIINNRSYSHNNKIVE